MEAVVSVIDDKYAQLGGVGGVLGPPVGGEFATADGIGRGRHYQIGSIYWAPSIGAHEVHGSIRDKWSEHGLESGLLGFPLTDETTTPDGVGRFNHFQRGSIYWSPTTGAHEVHGAIGGKWHDLGWELGVLGYPLTDETATPDGVGRFIHFQKVDGSIYWHPATGAHEVYGAIKGRWTVLQSERGRLGYPISGETATPHGFGRMSRFQGGEIYWDGPRGAYEVWPPPAPRTCSGSLEGTWQVASFDSLVVGVHAVLLRTGRLLFWNYRDPPGEHEPSAPQPHGDSAVVNLDSGQRVAPAQASGEPNLFCAGQSLLADGRLLVAGGEREQPHVTALHTFTPGGGNGGRWDRVGTMSTGRWYPTCVTLHDGRVLILGGKDWRAGQPARDAHTFEIWDPVNGVSAPRAAPVIAEASGFDTYPFMHVLPSGKLFMHAGTRSRFLDLATLQHDATALEAAARPGRNGRTYGMQGTSVLLPLRPDTSPPYRARIMLIGGGGAPPIDMRTDATKSCEILDMGAAAPAWTLAPPMANPRVMPDAVLLPDGTVFVANGSSTGFADNGANPVYNAERYDPQTNSWEPACTMTVPRLYHATALLLPDGRVLTAGTDSQWNPDPFHHSELRMELYSPPYLFRGGNRPVIEQPPTELSWNTTATIAVSGPTVTAACLIRCGSATHSFNSDQRYVGLTIMSQQTGSITVRTPPNGFVAPPGYYLLFVLTAAGVPSVAPMVRLGPP